MVLLQMQCKSHVENFFNVQSFAAKHLVIFVTCYVLTREYHVSPSNSLPTGRKVLSAHVYLLWFLFQFPLQNFDIIFLVCSYRALQTAQYAVDLFCYQLSKSILVN